jgi:hypothetical protein
MKQMGKMKYYTKKKKVEPFGATMLFLFFFFFFTAWRHLWAENVLGIFAIVVTRRAIVTDIVGTSQVATVSSSTTNMSSALPDDLSKVASNTTVAGGTSVIIIILDFIIPSINDGLHGRIAIGNVLASAFHLLK